jgi:hypothetical protein
MRPQFKAGDRVLCIEGSEFSGVLITGVTYEVQKISAGMVQVTGTDGRVRGWLPKRFKHLHPEFCVGSLA